ncbi:MAG: carboxypeptidase-like regulatory domain-containing protein [Planctomycetaceae bacterium]
MKMLRRAAQAAVVMACCGLLVPGGLSAATPQAASPNRDITLTATGSLRGSVVNGEGHAIDGATVLLHQHGKEVARTVTRVDGSFEVVGLRNGVYELAAGTQVTPVRLWSAEVAPPASRDQAVLVVGGNVVRGQDMGIPFAPGGLDLITLWTLGASTGALVLTAVNQADINDIQDKLDKHISP